MARGAAVFAAALAAAVSAYNVSHTPAMGFNTWNKFGCSVNETILQQAAKAMHDTGLQAVGYTFVNSDDCWMLDERDAQGNLIPNPSKFPSGLNTTVAYIHSLGLKAGLYTAAAPHTCAGYMGACMNEAQDAAWYAAHEIDYLKDDACGVCRDADWLADYGAMQQGLWAAGRPILLSVEGAPNVVNMSTGGFGNSKRVGHDITAAWRSMVSLVDIGSGLWPFAHNCSDERYGGYFNDLDMLEVGNGDFTGAPGLVLSQAHFAMWCIMKAPLLLGNDLSALDNYTLSVVANSEAISINQDPLGVQGRRVAVFQPSNNSLVPTSFDTVVVLAPCDESVPTQTWQLVNQTLPNATRNELYLMPCNTSDPYQQWSFPGVAGAASSPLKNVGAQLCVDAAGQGDPASLDACTGAASQQWVLGATSDYVQSSSPAHCLDVWNFQGPDVELGSCKTPGNNDANQRWNVTTLPGGYVQLITQSPSTGNAKCLSASAGPAGGLLQTSDASGNEWCMYQTFGSEGGLIVAPCSTFNPRSKGGRFALQPVGNPPASGTGNYSVSSGSAGLSYNNGFGASGPLPHTRYTTTNPWSTSLRPWLLDLGAATSGVGTHIQAPDTQGIIDDDLVGNVTQGGAFCLEAATMGLLEVWTAPLSNGRYAAALWNRSPGNDSITLSWSHLNAWAPQGFPIAPSQPMVVQDVWAGADRGTFTGSYTAQVASHAVALLILLPA